MSFRRNLVSPNEEGTHAPPPAATPSMRLLAWNEEEQARERLNFPFPDDSKAPETGDSVRGYFRKMKERHQHRVATYAFLDWLAVFLPCVRWLRTYQVRKWLLSDIVAGLSVGFMVVPQGMSYANLAGLPSVYGLYGAFLPCIVYSLVGSSRQLAVGPVAVTSLLIGTKLKDILPAAADIQNPNAPAPGQEEIQEQYNHLAIQLAFLVACLYTGVGVLRLGFVTNFLSHAVIGGFTSGAAITIGLSQVKYILGFSVPRQERLQDQAKTYVENMHNLKWQEFIMGSTFLLILVVMKYVGKNFKRLRFIRAVGPLTVCIIGICTVYIGHVDTKGIKVVGPIKKGLPDPTVQWWFPMPEISTLFPTAIIVMLVDLLESTSIARALARKNKYELVANQEIVGLGLANFAGAAFSCYTTTGSFSRSAVNNESGAKSGLACFITAWVVGFVLIFLTPIFERLPMNTLGAIILSSIVGLLEYEQAIYLWKVNKLDLFVWMASFLGVLFISVEIGLGIAIGLAVLIVIYESAFPHTALVGRIPGTSIWRNIKQYPQAQLTPGLMVVRIDAPLYFANIQWVKEKLEQYLDHHRTWSADRGIPLEYAILDFSPVTHVDATAVHTLEILIEALAEEGTQLVLANPSTAVIRSLDKARVCDILGRDWIFVSVNEAVQFCSRQLAERGLVVQPAESVWPKGAGYGSSHGSGAHSPSSGSPPRSPPGAAPSVALVTATSMRRSASGAGYTAPPPLQSPTPQPQLQQQPSSGRPGSGPAPSPALAAGNSLRRLPSAAGGAGIAPPEGVPQQPPRPSLPGSSVDPAAAAPVADVDAEPAVVFLPTGSVSVRGSQSGISTGAASPTLPRPPSNALGGASALPAATN